MNCENVKKELELMYDGKKPSAEALSHIKGCASCRAEYDAVLKITCAFKDDVRIPAGFNEAVWNKIGQPAPFVFGSLFRPAFVLAGAAAAALVVFMFVNTGNVASKKQGDLASKPAAEKTRIAKKNAIMKIMKKQDPVMQEQQAPAVAENKTEQAPAAQETPASVTPGKMPALVKSNGAEKDYFIKEEENRNLNTASFDKRPVMLEGPLLVKNNVVKPLSGQAMTFVYKVEDTCSVLIRIYNRKGEPVKTLVQSLQGPGIYTETWKGEDDKNAVVGDGIYLVHVKTCLTEQKIKAMVVK
jgi:flagellar hook assembly protein FlgD